MAKGIKQHKRIDFYVELKGKKLYLCSAENNPIQMKLDITCVWDFFEKVKDLPKNDK